MEKIYYKLLLGSGKWKPFIIIGIQIYDIDKAIEIIRTLGDGSKIGLATESQMKLDNTQWDNF